jgi:hypothetical protein
MTKLSDWGIKKEYKYFNFPNHLTALEIFYFYLREFSIIPSHIPTKDIIKNFNHTSEDYLKKHLDTGSFRVIVSNLFFNFCKNHQALNKHTKGLSTLMHYCSELDDDCPKDIKENKKRLKIYLQHPKDLHKNLGLI